MCENELQLPNLTVSTPLLMGLDVPTVVGLLPVHGSNFGRMAGLLGESLLP